MKQKWQCKICGHTYTSPIRVTEVQCPKPHMPKRGRSGLAAMTLIEGELPPTKEKSNGKS